MLGTIKTSRSHTILLPLTPSTSSTTVPHSSRSNTPCASRIVVRGGHFTTSLIPCLYTLKWRKEPLSPIQMSTCQFALPTTSTCAIIASGDTPPTSATKGKTRSCRVALPQSASSIFSSNSLSPSAPACTALVDARPARNSFGKDYKIHESIFKEPLNVLMLVWRSIGEEMAQ